MDITPVASYVFPASKIWFFQKIFVCQFQNCVKIMQYPNLCLRILKHIQNISNVKMSNKLQIIYYKNGKQAFEEYGLDEQWPNIGSKFIISNDFIKYKTCDAEVACFEIHDTFNVIINNFKAYRYILKLEYYELEEYDLFFAQGKMLFDADFFKKYRLKYDHSYIFANNGKDFIICVENLVTLNMLFQHEIAECIVKARMTTDLIILETKLNNELYVVIMDLEFKEILKIHKSQKTFVFENTYIGILILDETNARYVSHPENPVVFHKNMLLKAYEDFEPLGFSVHKNIFYVYASFNSTLVQIYPSRLEFNHRSKIIFEMNDFQVYKKSCHINRISASSFFEDQFLIANRSHVYYKKGEFIAKKSVNLVSEPLYCDVRNMDIYFLEHGKIIRKNFYDLRILTFISDVSQSFEDLPHESYTSLEQALHTLLIHNKHDDLANTLHRINLAGEKIICNLFRRVDLKGRKFLITVLRNGFFENISSCDSFISIFAILSVDYEKFIKACISERRFKIITGSIQYLRDNGAEEDYERLIMASAKFGCYNAIKSEISEINEHLKSKRILSFIFSL